MERKHAVSVVVPTRGRPDMVSRAVLSALHQTVSPAEVIVVVDGPDAETVSRLESLDDRLLVIPHDVSQGAGAARNTGIAAARGDLIAMLDDDDTWRPRKLELQLARLDELRGDRPVVLGCAGEWDHGSVRTTWPTRAPEQGERLAHYLFVRDHAGEGVLPTPSLLVTAALAKAHPLPTHLRTHEEWDWMLDLEKAGAVFDVVMEPLVDIDARPRRTSVSSGAGWRNSLAWALGRADDLGDALGPFIMTEVARAAALESASRAQQTAIGVLGAAEGARTRDLARFAGRPALFAARRLVGRGTR